LTADAGEVVELGDAYAGWAHATNARGGSGWLPIEHLSMEGSAARFEPDSADKRPN
jgi:hypothetical protein